MLKKYENMCYKNMILVTSAYARTVKAKDTLYTFILNMLYYEHIYYDSIAKLWYNFILHISQLRIFVIMLKKNMET